MHDVTLVYTEYNHRLEVWVLGKRAANTTADRQQYTNTSKVCDDTMSMEETQRLINKRQDVRGSTPRSSKAC